MFIAVLTNDSRETRSPLPPHPSLSPHLYFLADGACPFAFFQSRYLKLLLFRRLQHPTNEFSRFPSKYTHAVVYGAPRPWAQLKPL